MKVCRMLFSALICFISFTQVTVASVYIQTASQMNQLSTSRTLPQVLNLGKVDVAQGIQLANNVAVVTEPGTYFAVISVQIGADKNATDSGFIDLSGYFDLWLTRNNKPIPNTNTRQYINNGSTSVLLTQSIVQLKAKDSVGASFLTTNPTFGLIAVPATKNEPSVSSVLFSMFKLN